MVDCPAFKRNRDRTRGHTLTGAYARGRFGVPAGAGSMPHLIVEYSRNLEDQVDIADLMERLHTAALATGVFPLGGIRVRAEPRDRYLIADKDPENLYLHLTARIGHGRDTDTKKAAGDALFQCLTECLHALFVAKPLSLSLEIQEIDPALTWKQNNIHERLKTGTKP